MSRLRLLLLLTGLGALLTGGPVSALVAPGPDGESLPVAARSAPALRLLTAAAHAARTQAWRGTQQVLVAGDGRPRSTVLELEHVPGTGSSVRVVSRSAGSQADTALAPDLLDDKLLRLLAARYDLRLAGRATCAGRSAELVDVLRPGRTGTGALAARFWVDRSSGLVLRRDVLDADGVVVRSSAFRDVAVVPAEQLSTAATPLLPTGEHLDDGDLQDLADGGWPVVRQLPAGLELFEARLHEARGGQVLQLSYSDGLSTLSLFVQDGDLPAGATGRVRTMGAATVRESRRTPEQLVWSGGDRTWTLVSDAPDAVVEEAVSVLPHGSPTPQPESLPSRLWRGMSRVGSWLNPFD